MVELTQQEIIKKSIDEYIALKPFYQKMENYYRGLTDAILNYKTVKSRANNKISNNFIKKFIKEEVSYAVGNKITYTSKTSNKAIIKAISNNIAHWSEVHEQNLMKNMLKFGYCYELYYIDKYGRFSAKVLNPLNSYAYIDENDNIQFLMHFWTKKFHDDLFMDLHYPDRIEHYNITDGQNKIGETIRPFNYGFVPASICKISEELEYDTLYNDLKTLQDGYEINLSDISNEISDFRNAYLVLLGCDMNDEQMENAKTLGAFKLPRGDKIDVKWLVKNINDAFIQNTLTTIKENMYELSSHINSNQKLQSNTSSLALRTRLISLEQRVKLNCNAMADCIKNRLKTLFVFLKVKNDKQFLYTDVKIKFTPMIPQDDLMTAQILAQAGDKISIKTGISQFSFVDNPEEEVKRIEEEQKSTLEGMKLLNSVGGQ